MLAVASVVCIVQHDGMGSFEDMTKPTAFESHFVTKICSALLCGVS